MVHQTEVLFRTGKIRSKLQLAEVKLHTYDRLPTHIFPQMGKEQKLHPQKLEMKQKRRLRQTDDPGLFRYEMKHSPTSATCHVRS